MQENDGKTGSIGKPPYNCSNPNCRNIFSIPKVIKYYVCPICQTLVGMSTTDEKATDEEYAPVEEPQARKALAETVQTPASESFKIETNEPKRAEPKTITQTRTEQKVIEPKTIEPKTIEPKTIEPKKQESKIQQIASKEKEDNRGDPICRYYLGYLSQRDKGEGIPDTCVECNKSLDCMLSEYYKSETTVAEIKKWYRPKL